jgi:hypothetical protein
MSDLRERLQELADVAARQGRTPGPEAAQRGARRRRLTRAGGTAVLLAIALVAAAVGAGWFAGPAPLTPTATTRPSATTASVDSIQPDSTIPPDVSIVPDPGAVQRPVGSPPGTTGQQMVHDVATAVAECRGGPPDPPTVLVAWGKGHGRTWLIEAAPPRPGEEELCWADGLFDAGGFGKNSSTRSTELEASGSQNLRSGNQYWGHIVGAVTKRAARIQVLFSGGIPPLELVPIQAGYRFPVNFFAGFYRQPKEDKNLEWFVTRVIAYDGAGNKVAECQSSPGPGPRC